MSSKFGFKASNGDWVQINAKSNEGGAVSNANLIFPADEHYTEPSLFASEEEAHACLAENDLVSQAEAAGISVQLYGLAKEKAA